MSIALNIIAKTSSILRVVESVGYGLDENAIEALKQWTFRPGLKNGQPVDVALKIEVNFHLRDDPPVNGPASGKGVFELKTNSPQ